MSRDVEDGHTRINNEILEALYQGDLSAREMRCVLFLIRKTYGWGQKTDSISLSQWAEETGMDQGHVRRTLKGLIERNIMIRESSSGGRNKASVYKFNKYFETWKSKETRAESAPTQTGAESAPVNGLNRGRISPKKQGPNQPHTKEKKESSCARAHARDPFIEAYERIWGMPISSPKIGELIHEWSERVPIALWEYGLTESLKNNARRWNYLESILRRVEADGLPVNGTAPSTVDIAWEELT